MKLYSFFFLSCIVLLANCQRKGFEPSNNKQRSINANNLNKSTSLLSPEDYAEFIDQPSNASVMISASRRNTPLLPEYPRTYFGDYLVGAGFKDNNDSQNWYDNGVVKIGDKSLVYDQQEGQYSTQDFDFCHGFFGKVIRFEIPTPHKGIYIDSLYVPKLLLVTSPIHDVDNIVPVDVSNGLAITWQPDENNYNGILIMVDYPPLPNEPTDRSVTPPYIFAQSVSDNGRFTIPKEVFEKIPEGRRRGSKITLYRGAFKSVVDDEKHATKISGHSSVVITLRD